MSSFLVISMNSFKLKNLGSMRRTNHRLKRKKRELREIRVGLGEPKVRPSFPGSHLCCSSACWAVDVVQHVGRETSKEFVIGDFERSPPHLFLYLLLFKRKTKVETTRTLPVLNTGESTLYSNKK